MIVIVLDGTLENLKWLKAQVRDKYVVASIGVSHQKDDEYVRYGGRVQSWSTEGNFMFEIEVFSGKVDTKDMNETEIERLVARKTIEVRHRLNRILRGTGFLYRFGSIIEIIEKDV